LICRVCYIDAGAFHQAKAETQHHVINTIENTPVVPHVFTFMQARSTKAKARVDAYGVLVEKARDNPTADLRVDFGRVGMARLGELLLCVL
jgi:hypothetical protein